jgi:3-isopropylmalate/(R)-2-methylmalate dehydratase small subunit
VSAAECKDVVAGRVIRLGDNVDTDVILPGPYLNLTDPDQLALHLLEGYDPAVAARVNRGDILVAGENFGCGSSREQAPVAIIARGVGAIIASSFARIFLRNAVNLGLPVIESRAAANGLQDGEGVRIALDRGEIEGERSGSFTVAPTPPFLLDIIARGGLVPWVRARLDERQARANVTDGRL